VNHANAETIDKVDSSTANTRKVGTKTIGGIHGGTYNRNSQDASVKVRVSHKRSDFGEAAARLDFRKSRGWGPANTPASGKIQPPQDVVDQ